MATQKREIYRPRRRSERARRRRRSGRYDPHANPIGVLRRRWPRIYDGPEESDDGTTGRERRAVDLIPLPTGGRSHLRRRTGMASLRNYPLRNGLIGLAVAGSAAPIAVNRYQQALRTDPSHEAGSSQASRTTGKPDEALSSHWQSLADQEASAAAEREEAIGESIDLYAEFGLDRELAGTIYDTAVENDIDPAVAFGLVRAESSFRNSSTSPVGAIGLTQLMPKTASWLQPGVTRAELRDPATNLSIGFRYLKQLIDKYEGNERLALVAYNRGPGTVDREIRRGRNPDNGYADFVHGKEDHGHSLYTKR